MQRSDSTLSNVEVNWDNGSCALAYPYAIETLFNIFSGDYPANIVRLKSCLLVLVT